MRYVFLYILPLILVLSGCGVRYYEGPISPHFDGTVFSTPEAPAAPKSLGSVLKWQFTRTKPSWPTGQEPKRFDVPPARVADGIRISMVGHTSLLIQLNGLNILHDPIWSERASPVSWAGPRRSIAPGIKRADLPPIDLVLISHNHYDHLDLPTLDWLQRHSRPRIITPLGNDTILRRHNPDFNVTAHDWGDCVTVNSTRICLEPMAHWSARGLNDRFKALWAAFMIQTPQKNIYIVGDSGFRDGVYFRAAAAKYSRIDIAALPIGAYEPRWFMRDNHMNPEEAIMAAELLGQPWLIPTHYDVFPLADEPHGEALPRLLQAAKHYPADKILPLQPGEFHFWEKLGGE